MNDDFQIVYVLTNPAMPGLVKIGMTSQNDVENRLKQLYTTGVPVPFECIFACKVKDAIEVERALHFAYGDFRINQNREFFKINAERVIVILKLLHLGEVTSQVNKEIESDIDQEDIKSGDRLKSSRRPRMNFKVLGIPVDSVLKFKNGDQEVRVISDKKVIFNGEEMSLTHATRKVLNLADDYPLQPSPHWIYNGRTVDEIYDEYYNAEDEEAA